MKITRRQLNSIIKEELELNEIAHGPVGDAAKGVALAQYIVYKKAMIPAAEKLWNDPKFAGIRAPLEAVGDAVSGLPKAAVDAIYDTVVETINTSLESLKIDVEPEEGEAAEDPGKQPGDMEREMSDDETWDEKFPTSKV